MWNLMLKLLFKQSIVIGKCNHLDAARNDRNIVSLFSTNMHSDANQHDEDGIPTSSVNVYLDADKYDGDKVLAIGVNIHPVAK